MVNMYTSGCKQGSTSTNKVSDGGIKYKLGFSQGSIFTHKVASRGLQVQIRFQTGANKYKFGFRQG